MKSRGDIKVDQMIEVDDFRWQDYIKLLNEYSKDKMGLGKALSPHRCEELLDKLPRVPNGRYLIALIDEEIVGILSAFIGFSSFQAKSILNIHDLAVQKEWRGCGIGKALSRAAEELAKKENCCRMSLEARTDNELALQLYEKIGFSSRGSDYKMIFMEKSF